MNVITKRFAMSVFAALVLSSAFLGRPGPAAAATEASVNGCTVTPASPYLAWVDGVKYAYANVYVYCWVSRTGIVNAQIMEDDGVSDDAVSGLGSASFSIFAGQTRKVLTIRGRCSNFDFGSAEELYNKARINIGGLNSAWANTSNVSTTC
ncbi:MAG: hypothetical protein H0V87_05875 [Chloroflexi bacterium]|nr:hypothetical protein [Chloroflexota bacterium]